MVLDSSATAAIGRAGRLSIGLRCEESSKYLFANHGQGSRASVRARFQKAGVIPAVLESEAWKGDLPIDTIPTTQWFCQRRASHRSGRRGQSAQSGQGRVNREFPLPDEPVGPRTHEPALGETEPSVFIEDQIVLMAPKPVRNLGRRAPQLARLTDSTMTLPTRPSHGTFEHPQPMRGKAWNVTKNEVSELGPL